MHALRHRVAVLKCNQVNNLWRQEHPVIAAEDVAFANMLGEQLPGMLQRRDALVHLSRETQHQVDDCCGLHPNPRLHAATVVVAGVSPCHASRSAIPTEMFVWGLADTVACTASTLGYVTDPCHEVPLPASAGEHILHCAGHSCVRVAGRACRCGVGWRALEFVAIRAEL